MSEPGKGSLVIPPNDGDLIKGFTDAYTVRGDTAAFGAGTSNPGEGAPVWLEGRSVDRDATNSLGSVGGTQSDPMFDKFKHEAKGWEDQVDAQGSQSGEKVSSGALVEGGGKSDPMFQELPDEQSKGPGAKSSQADKD